MSCCGPRCSPFSTFVKGARFAEALRVFAEMDVALNAATLATVRGAREAGAVRVWRAVQGWYVKRERELSPTVGNAVLDMYVKCEKLDSARWMFDSSQLRVHCLLDSYD
jgi:hypothetical protein